MAKRHVDSDSCEQNQTAKRATHTAKSQTGVHTTPATSNPTSPESASVLIVDTNAVLQLPPRLQQRPMR